MMNKKIILKLLSYARQEEFCDLIIEDKNEKIVAHYHFDDGRKKVFVLPKKPDQNLSLALRQILKITTEELIHKKYYKIINKHYQLNFFLTIIPFQANEKIVINIISKNERIFKLKQLGLQKNNLKILQKNLQKRSGLILLSSPPGQGKSTTLYSLLQELNLEKYSSYFINNKHKYQVHGLNYLDTNQNSWAKVLTIDSDIIATEIINEEDLKNAIRAAATGRLVLATINAESVWEVLLAYFKINLPWKLKIDSLKIIVNQCLHPLQRKSNNKTPFSPLIRKEIGLFEIFNLTTNLKKFLYQEELEIKTEKFWKKFNSLAHKEGFEPLEIDRQEKNRNNL